MIVIFYKKKCFVLCVTIICDTLIRFYVPGLFTHLNRVAFFMKAIMGITRSVRMKKTKPEVESLKNIQVPDPVTMDSIFDLLNRDQRTTITINRGDDTIGSNHDRREQKIIYDNCDIYSANRISDFHEMKQTKKPFKSDSIKRFHINPYQQFSPKFHGLFSENKNFKRTERRVNLKNIMSSKC